VTYNARAGRIDSFESIPGLLKSLRILSLYIQLYIPVMKTFYVDKAPLREFFVLFFLNRQRIFFRTTTNLCLVNGAVSQDARSRAISWHWIIILFLKQQNVSINASSLFHDSVENHFKSFFYGDYATFQFMLFTARSSFFLNSVKLILYRTVYSFHYFAFFLSN
jgi:hypothetical protein